MGPSRGTRSGGYSDGGERDLGCSATGPAVAVVAVVALLALGLSGCDSPSGTPASTAASSTADPAVAAQTMIEQQCLGCHAASAIQGKTAADIRNASRQIPSMKRFDGQLTDEQLQALQRALAGEPGPD